MKINIKQILVVTTLLFLSVMLFEYSGIDMWLQDYFYNFQSGQWVLDRNEAISKFIFYDGVKVALILLVLAVFTGAVFFRNSSFVQSHREGIFIFLLSAIVVPLTVGALKATTNIPCPRDLSYYGGTYPHITLLTPYPESFYQSEKIRCYPAGHASGGFVLLSLVFLFKKRRNRVIAAGVALSIGWSMGIYKMLIGDHFIGHTFVTMVLAWLLILIIAKSVQDFPGKYKKYSPDS